jgi:heme exporter protein D
MRWMLGIKDIYVWLAYLLCILSSLLCVVYGLVTWNRGEEAIEPDDRRWAAQEKELEEEL